MGPTSKGVEGKGAVVGREGRGREGRAEWGGEGKGKGEGGKGKRGGNPADTQTFSKRLYNVYD